MSASQTRVEVEPQAGSSSGVGAAELQERPTAVPSAEQPTPQSQERRVRCPQCHELVVEQQRFFVDQFYIDWWNVICSIERSGTCDEIKLDASDLQYFLNLRRPRTRARNRQAAARR
ncbi:uncharacterized protein LOC126299243 [Schistocerca gregaria]|uniref:uncharacterized protein LOC126299243 n=1 Tax=Schistocerca gregaria TaxID=7010 RepID=UPI00211E3B50|nr:uncharacterized protein LOC126299243 [Schistocerca gregaria]